MQATAAITAHEAYAEETSRLTRADLVPLLRTASQMSEVLNGKRELSMSMVRKVRERFRIPVGFAISQTRSHGVAA